MKFAPEKDKENFAAIVYESQPKRKTRFNELEINLTEILSSMLRGKRPIFVNRL